MEGVLEECGEWVDESWPRFLFFFMFCLNVKWLWPEREGNMTVVNRPASLYICICMSIVSKRYGRERNAKMLMREQDTQGKNYKVLVSANGLIKTVLGLQ